MQSWDRNQKRWLDEERRNSHPQESVVLETYVFPVFMTAQRNLMQKTKQKPLFGEPGSRRMALLLPFGNK